MELYRRLEERGNEAWALRLMGELATRAEQLDVHNAEAHYGEAMALAAELGMRPLMAHCHLGLGLLYRRGSQREREREHIVIAHTMYREMDMPFWARKAEAHSTEPEPE